MESHMNLREKARVKGGDKLVGQIDEADKVQRKMIKDVQALVAAAIDGAEEDSTEQQLVLVAICEALSLSFANATALCTVKAFNNERSNGIICAMKSVSANINQAFDNIDALDNGVAAKIMAAAKGAK
jgi:hypothetical protein